MSYKTLIGLEIHVELNTNTKIFCGCSTEFGKEPNTQVCPVCLGLPGSLPIINEKVIEYGIKAGLALNCKIANKVNMDRKNYFYQDLVKGFQTTQYYNPLCENGYLNIENEGSNKKIRIKRIHIEEDTGKSIYDKERNILLDYNRCGVPLIEIVTEPDINSSKELSIFLENLKQIIEYIEVSDCKMEEGSLRCDVNINIVDENNNIKTEIVELKNLNSFKNAIRAVEYEESRHIELLKYKKIGSKETRRWDESENKTLAMRSKEDALDYRYFPEPDIVNVLLNEDMISDIEKSLPELPHDKKIRFIDKYELSEYDVEILIADKKIANFFEETLNYTKEAKQVANWITGDMLRRLNDSKIKIDNIKFESKDLGELINYISNGDINNSTAKDIFRRMFEQGERPKVIIEDLGLKQINDDKELRLIVKEILSQNQDAVNEYKQGKDKVLGFLVGQIMKATKGKANPKKINNILLEMVSKA
ncbi:aspartyl/glutamyl-tRNA(Asn/Gln) amidotransferase subunit B [Gottschalkia purinilytica]|uniref:Aspartyl/glutamyl-tRNA(Asn/Gln) amidotransferase subunit B n=1 Tax=Gottschalkia purinilytica TaxID=1503 RepID=A0A0L0W6R7_GOTPU|nr:Asp-tRNA(Asn)/Glu-tRNA(Gln) amidotransferase subunit GatB [Gottschalkia purinilytica]KNF07243.1 aspartyl/glutamyl-tRNA(Asn/Gln) amidotransferase subunit B [Gottschalkia purinilytica]